MHFKLKKKKPVSSLSGRPEKIVEILGALPEIREADLVFAVDEDTNQPSLVYGQEVLTAIVLSGQRALGSFYIRIHPSTNELDTLLAVIEQAKGDAGGE